MSIRKYTRINAPYTANEINKSRQLLHGSAVGGLLNSLDISYTEAQEKASGLGKFKSHTDNLIRLMESKANAGLNLLAEEGDWLAVGDKRSMFSEHQSDVQYMNGSLSNANSEFIDSSNAPFSSDDAGRWILVHRGPNAGLYRITRFNSADNIEINGSSFSTESNIYYSILDNLANYSIKKVEYGIASNQILVSVFDEFLITPRPNGSSTESSYTKWSLLSPPGITLQPFSFIHHGVIIREDETITVKQSPPPAGFQGYVFLVAYNQDSLPESNVEYRTVYGFQGIENAVVLAYSYMSIYGQSLTWHPVNPESVYSPHINEDVYTSRVDMVQHPPRLSIENSKGNEVWRKSLEPLVQQQRQERVSEKVLRHINQDLYNDRNMGTVQPLYLKSFHDFTGVNKNYGLDVDTSDNQDISLSSSFALVGSDLMPASGPISSNVPVCLVNQFGTQLYAFKKEVSDIVPSISITRRRVRDLHDPNDLEIDTVNDGVQEISGHVDSHGYFWIIFSDDNSGSNQLYVTCLDPYAEAILFTSQLCSNNAIGSGHNFGVRTDRSGNVYIYWMTDGGICRFRRTSYNSGSIASLGDIIEVDPGVAASFFTLEVNRDNGDIVCLYSDSVLEKIKSKHFLSDGTSYKTQEVDIESDIGTITPSSISSACSIAGEQCEMLSVFSAEVAGSSRALFGLFFHNIPSQVQSLQDQQSSVPAIDSLSLGFVDGYIVSGHVNSQSSLLLLDKNLQLIDSTESAHKLSSGTNQGLSVSKDPKSNTVYAASITRNVSSEDDAHIGAIDFYREENVKSLFYADIHKYQYPIKPGFGLIKAVNATPASTPLGIDITSAKELVDGDPETTIASSINLSVGCSFQAQVVSCVSLIDQEESDGFSLGVNPLVAFEVWTSNDNTSWTQRSIESIKRIKGQTFIEIASQSVKFVQVRLAQAITVPKKLNHPGVTSPYTIRQIKVYEHPIDTHDQSSRKYQSGSRLIEFKKTEPSYIHLTVGDGYSSFGDFQDTDALHSAIRHVRSHRERGNSALFCITILPGLYHLRNAISIPSNVTMEFKEGSIVYDMVHRSDSITVDGYSQNSVAVINGLYQIQCDRSLHVKGIIPGNTIYIGDEKYYIDRISASGKFVTLTEPIRNSSGSYTVQYMNNGVKISGLHLETYKHSDDADKRTLFLKSCYGLQLKNVYITDSPSFSRTVESVLIESAIDSFIDIKGNMLSNNEAIHILSCKDSSLNLDIKNSSGIAILIESCTGLQCGEYIRGIGDGSNEKDIHLKDLDNTNRLGILKSTTSLGGKGVKIEASSPSSDELINLLVHSNANVNILNGGIYESLHSVALSIIQSEHSLPSMPTSTGYIDGLVSDAIIDSASSI